MHLMSERSVIATTVALVARQSSGFVVAPVLAPVQRSRGCHARDTEPRMFGGAPTVRLNLATLDADTAERKAERLWGLGDAEEQSVMEGLDEGMSKGLGLNLQETRNRAMLEAKDHHLEDDFMDEAESSALRRYEYSAVVDTDDVDDDNEYYI